MSLATLLCIELMESDFGNGNQIVRTDAVVAEITKLIVVDDHDAATRNGIPSFSVRKHDDGM